MSELANLLGIQPGDVVAIVGAGGKHTLMSRLADELPATGERVVLTSTTNLHRGAVEALPLTRMTEPGWEAALRAALDAGGRAVVVDRAKGPGMEIGIAPSRVALVAAASGGATILVKADGARKRSLKAPGPDEPALPPRTNLVVVVCSLDAIGRPLDDSHVHRPEIVRALAPAERITIDTVASVAGHGYAPKLPSDTISTLYLSHASDDAALRRAHVIAERVGPLFGSVIAADTIQGRFHLLC